jgi:hypothetical protein
LPFGAVMATGAASQLAAECGLRAAVAPLLWLAVAQAAWIAGRAAVRRRGTARVPVTSRPGLREPGERAGVLTVPLGLAVITAGLAVRHGTLASSLAPAGLAMTWVSAAVFTGGFVASAVAGGRELAALDGSWFLAPAVLLGGSVAAGACVPDAAAAGQALLRGLAVTAAVSGLAGYWAVMAVAAARVSRHGLGGTRPVLWWISAGCGGLAAAAAAKALGAPDGRWAAAPASALRAAAAVTLLVAALVLVPVIVQSIRFLIRKRPVLRPVPWPPAFSSGVIALGAIDTGAVLHLPPITVAGKAAGIATLVLWAVTMSWNAAVLGRRLA